MTFRNADIFNFLSKLTSRKAFNAAKVFASYYIARYSKQPVQWGLPFNISIEPTTSCNLRCPECPSGLRSFTRPTGMLNNSFFQKTVNELSNELLYLYFYFQGEPYLNPGFLDMVKYASDKKIYTVTSTNAHYLDEENAKQTVVSGLDRIIISIDGTTQETYESYRVGGQLNKVLEGTKNLVHWRKQLQSKTPHIIFQFLVVKPNEHQIEEVERIAKEIGVDEVKLKTAQIYDYQNGSPLIPENEKYARYQKQTDGTYTIKNDMENHCWKLWHSTVITWDGKIVPCCFDKDAAHPMGDLNTHTFREIWNNPAYLNFRTKILQSRKETDICQNCTEGLKVWM
jgi:radical SAM protein with 4Fe4S-binding SPASM domain